MKRWSWIGTAGAAFILVAPAVSTAQQPAPGVQTAPSRPAVSAPAPAATPAPAGTPAPVAAPAPAPGAAQPATAARPGAGAAPARGAALATPGARLGDARRQRSYAACNRGARNRNLSGGLRRSFITKCRLGLEKP
jgi:hypothetical protein